MILVAQHSCCLRRTRSNFSTARLMSGTCCTIKTSIWSALTHLTLCSSYMGPQPLVFLCLLPFPSNLSSLRPSSPSFLLLPPFFISEIIKFFPFTGTNPLRPINYFTSGTELSHCEQHIAGINAHQLAKLCAFSKWVAGFWGNGDTCRPLRDCSMVKCVCFLESYELMRLKFALP